MSSLDDLAVVKQQLLGSGLYDKVTLTYEITDIARRYKGMVSAFGYDNRGVEFEESLRCVTYQILTDQYQKHQEEKQ